MAEETTPESKVKTEEKPKAKAKVEKVKQPTIEELPFEEFVGKHYVPSLAKALQEKGGIADLDLKFAESQVQGRWLNGLRSFTIYFTNQDINAQKAFSCADGGLKPSTIEPFLIDERKATLDLLVFGVVQRLNAQKWLMPN